jgi:hypothetical protein
MQRPRGLDHLVIAARDLDALASLYRRLGFTVGARNRHPWGTLNHIVQFDGHFLELIGLEAGFKTPAADEPAASFATFIAEYLDRRDGVAMLVCESLDAAADQLAFAARGIAKPKTLFFERRGKRPDGSDVHVAFTLAFAATPAIPGAGFFVCQQHFPEAFWNPMFQVHTNTVQGVAAAMMVAADPSAAKPFLSGYLGDPPITEIEGGLRFTTPRGAVEVLTPAGFATATGETVSARTGEGPHFAGIRFRLNTPAALRSQLTLAAVPHRAHRALTVVPAAAAFGAVLAFEGPHQAA